MMGFHITFPKKLDPKSLSDRMSNLGWVEIRETIF